MLPLPSVVNPNPCWMPKNEGMPSIETELFFLFAVDICSHDDSKGVVFGSRDWGLLRLDIVDGRWS
jgi:hypothetical protein